MTETAPEEIYFVPVVALGADGQAIAPVPPARLSGLVEAYVHALDCPCRGWPPAPFEHVYGWSRDPETYIGNLMRQDGATKAELAAGLGPEPLTAVGRLYGSAPTATVLMPIPEQDRRRHRCGERCVCPADGKPMLYAPARGVHACQDPECKYAHPDGDDHG